MAEKPRHPHFRLLLLIASPALSYRAAELYDEGRIPVRYRFHADGAATSEILDMLGLGSVEKHITATLLPKALADEMLVKLRRELHLGMPNTGIAATIPLSGGSARAIKLFEALEPETADAIRQEIREKVESDKMRFDYALITAIVDQGYSEEVAAAAREAGATGGTVFHSRRIGDEEAMQFWGISVQPEREIVLILAKHDAKFAIMQAISDRCGMQTPAHGVTLSLPVDAVAGLE